MEHPRRILIADGNEGERQALMERINSIVAGVEYSLTGDGTDALFKLNNAVHQIAFFAENLARRNALQITEYIVREKKFENMALVLLCPIPDNEHFVDEVVTGRVQFLASPADGKIESVVTRGFNFASHGDKTEFHLRFLATGDPLMREGDKADNVYLLKKGRLRACRKVNEKDITLGFVEIGEFVGEMAYINGEPRSADVIAEVPSELIEIPVECLDHVLFQKPAWSKALIKTLSRRLKTANITRAQ